MNKKLQIPLWVWKTMKISFHQFVLLALCCGMAYAHKINGQNVLEKSISLHAEGLRFKKVLSMIENQAGVQFVYSSSAIDTWQRVSLNVSNKRLDLVLRELLEPLSVGFSVTENRIILKSIPPAPTDKNKQVPRDSDQLEEDANKTIQGKVSGEDGEGLPGVSILLKGTQQGTTTDAEGIFSIVVPNDDAVLIFSFVGYVSQEATVGNRTSLEVSLMVDEKSLDEVVTIGYSSVQRRNITGAVASVNAKQLKDIPFNSAAEALTGRLAGVQITTSEGAPGADARVLIRGGGSITFSNDPLYIIDGVQVEDGLSAISPMDIEKIEVLKDASETAIYGSRGANGVVVITTKGGKAMATRVNYNAFFGIAQMRNKLSVLSPYEFAFNQYEFMGPTSTEFINQYGSFENIQRFKTIQPVDWQDEIFGRTAKSQTHNISVTGGTKATSFNVSYSNNSQEGIMIGSKFDRQLLNFKMDHEANSKLKIGLGIRYTAQTIDGAGSSPSAAGSISGLLRHAIKNRPYNGPDGELEPDVIDEQYFDASDGVFNPLRLAQSQYRKRYLNNLNLNGYLQYRFSKILSFRSTIGTNFSNPKTKSFDDFYTANARSNGAGQPIITLRNSDNYSLNNSNVFNLEIARAAHSFNILLGQEIYNLRSETRSDLLKYFPIGITPEKALNQLNLGTSSPQFPSTFSNESRLLSFFSGANYAYKDKYLVKVSLRGDYSSKFAPGKRAGYFPSGSLGWRISDEDFIKDSKVVSDLKLRASYGASGNNRITDYGYLTTFTSGVIYPLNETPVGGYITSVLANNNLKWETTLSRNIGLDLGLFENKLQVNIDVYKNTVKDLLLDVRIPQTSGYTIQTQNIGQTSNRGLEIQLNGSLIQRNDFSWNANFNIAFNRNRIDKLSTADSFFPTPSVTFDSGTPADYIVEVGKPLGSMYGYVSDGFYTLDDFNYDPATSIYTLKSGVADVTPAIGVPRPGWMKLKDLNGDGVIGESDKTIIGDATPTFTGGLNQQFRYKNFDLSLFLNFVVGNNIFNWNKTDFVNRRNFNTNMLSIMENRWRSYDDNGVNILRVSGSNVVTGLPPEQIAAVNGKADIWMPLSGAGAAYPFSWAVEDGSFLRFSNLTLGYSFPARSLKKIGVNNLRLYVTANNIAVITGYTGYDPEVNVRSSPMTPGVDYSAYPRSRNFVFGINLTL